MNTPSELPIPCNDALQHSAKLTSIIKKNIEGNHGEITFSEFMSAALYTPGFGYYCAGATKFGKDGDFITAPQVSPLFSQCLAKQCKQIMNALNKDCDILEFGAGTGIMAVDLLKTLKIEKKLPKHYYILEISPELRVRQQQAFKQHCPELMELVIWLEQLPPEPINGIIIANEVLDAMPVNRFVIENNEIYEMFVSWDNDSFTWMLDEPSQDIIKQKVNHLHHEHFAGIEPYLSEVNFMLKPWLHSVGSCLDQGLVLLIDYGFPQSEYYHPDRQQGTLMCHYQHRAHGDPLLWPGLQDITAHVDFTEATHIAADLEMVVSGFTTQAAFLLSLGITELVPEIMNTTAEQIKYSQQIQTLTSPSEMGELFKVLALAKNFDTPLQGFTLHDMAYRL